jgi:hypothetical protein
MGGLPEDILELPTKNCRRGSVAEGNPALAIQSVYALARRIKNELMLLLEL